MEYAGLGIVERPRGDVILSLWNDYNYFRKGGRAAASEDRPISFWVAEASEPPPESH